MVSQGRRTPPPAVALTRRGVVRGIGRLLPLCAFVVPVGIAFGVAATAEGLGPLQATLMSALVFTATAQFAAIELLNEPVAYVSLGLVTLSLSARHIVMGAALSSWINRLPVKKRLVTLFFLSDANFADAQFGLKQGETDLGPFLGGGLALWLSWAGSTAIGAFGGSVLGDMDAFGLGALMLCFFAASAFGMVRQSLDLIPSAVIAGIVAALTLPLLPTGWNIILAACFGGAVSLVWHAK